MENPHVPPEVGLIRKLSIWTKQLTLEWPLDWVVPGDLIRVADNSGWRSPTDRVVMMIGLIAEMYAHELATNDIQGSKNLPSNIDFANICRETFHDFSRTPQDEDWGFPFPATGRVVLLRPTNLGLAVSEAVDPDIDLVTYEDRQSWIAHSVPAHQAEERNLQLPGAVARAALSMAGRLPFSSRTFFAAAVKLGYEDPRDQAVAGFGALAQLVTTQAIVPGRFVHETFVPTGDDMAGIYARLVHLWFRPNEHDQRSEDKYTGGVFFILRDALSR